MPDNEDVIRRGRACVRLIEAIDALMADERRQDDRIVLQDARRLAIQRLRRLVGKLDPAITAQIMVASERVLGPMKDVMLN